MKEKETKLIAIRVSKDWHDTYYKEFRKALIDEGTSVGEFVRTLIEAYLKRQKR